MKPFVSLSPMRRAVARIERRGRQEFCRSRSKIRDTVSNGRKPLTCHTRCRARESTFTNDWFKMLEALTIGHSTHTLDHFLALLRHAGATAIADVPRLRLFRCRRPQFNRAALSERLRVDGMSYAFLGSELGGSATGA